MADISANNVWAVGFYRDGGDSSATKTLIDHWDGKQWNILSSPSSGPSDNNLYGVSSVSSSDAWAAGNFINGAGNARTLIEHWNGSRWSISPSPSPGAGGDNILGGIAAVSANDVWAVGGYDNGGSTHTLIEHFC